MPKDKQAIAVIMGGGRGTRLYPLTRERCKPAVPLAGKYRLIDIPISNCLHSGINRIFILTQFNTASLHRHITSSYHFDMFSGGYIDILAAEQTEKTENWYQGTADAVRRNLTHIGNTPHDLVIILSGDQLYRIDFRAVVQHHVDRQADVTIAAIPFPVSKVEGLGLMQVADDYAISRFVEKPRDPAVIQSLTLSDTLESRLSTRGAEKRCLASMGIYVFNRDVLRRALDNQMADFGREVIPSLLGKVRLSSYIFEGYWEDIGTVRAFFEANLALTDDVPPFDFFVPGVPIYTRARHLPASRIHACTVERAIIGDGCQLAHAAFKRCVVGIRSIVRPGTTMENVVMMGADFLEKGSGHMMVEGRHGVPSIGVGPGCTIRNAIIDKNARIGERCILSPAGKPDMWEAPGLMVRDGVLMVFKNAIIADGTVV